MLDSYVWGKVSRISPEAPVPVVMHMNTENRLGGAANVALNLKSLGAVPVMCSVIGTDESSRQFRKLVREFGMPDEGLIGVGRPDHHQQNADCCRKPAIAQG